MLIRRLASSSSTVSTYMKPLQSFSSSAITSTLPKAAPREFTIKIKETDVDPEFAIMQSPLKIGFLVAPLRRRWVPNAIAQLKFSPKRKYSEVIRRILNVGLKKADFLYRAIPEEMYIDEIVVNKGYSRKNITIMGRGRTGIGVKRWSHVWITLKSIDFDARIANAHTWSQEQKWRKRKELVQRLKSGDSIPPLKQIRMLQDDKE